MDINMFTISSEQWNTNTANDRIEAFASTNLAGLSADKAENWAAIGEAL